MAVPEVHHTCTTTESQTRSATVTPAHAEMFRDLRKHDECAAQRVATTYVRNVDVVRSSPITSTRKSAGYAPCANSGPELPPSSSPRSVRKNFATKAGRAVTRPAARHDCGVSDPQTAREAVETSLARAARAARGHQLCGGVERRRCAGARRRARSRPGTRRSGRSAARSADHRQGLDRRRRFAVYRRVRGSVAIGCPRPTPRSWRGCARPVRSCSPRRRCSRTARSSGRSATHAIRRVRPAARAAARRPRSQAAVVPWRSEATRGEHPPPGRVVRRAGPQAVGRTRADDRPLPARRRARRRAHGDRTDRRACPHTRRRARGHRGTRRPRRRVPARRPRCGRRRRGGGAPHRLVARRRALDRLGCDLRCGAGCRRAARDPGRDDRR